MTGLSFIKVGHTLIATEVNQTIRKIDFSGTTVKVYSQLHTGGMHPLEVQELTGTEANDLRGLAESWIEAKTVPVIAGTRTLTPATPTTKTATAGGKNK